MESTLLQALYFEYEDLTKQINSLNDKRTGVEELITKYGGEIPVQIASGNFDFSKVRVYPFNGTWKEKIIYALHRVPEPAPAVDIASILAKIEDKTTAEIAGTITQYCSSMALAGEIEVEKGYRNKYFLKS